MKFGYLTFVSGTTDNPYMEKIKERNEKNKKISLAFPKKKKKDLERWEWPQCIGFMLIRITKLLRRDKAALLKEDRKDRKADTRPINYQK